MPLAPSATRVVPPQLGADAFAIAGLAATFPLVSIVRTLVVVPTVRWNATESPVSETDG